jgi:hypothetical protein
MSIPLAPNADIASVAAVPFRKFLLLILKLYMATIYFTPANFRRDNSYAGKVGSWYFLYFLFWLRTSMAL